VDKIVDKVLSVATSNAALARIVSTFEFIHSNRRKVLSSKSVENSVFIKADVKEFNGDPAGREMHGVNSQYSQVSIKASIAIVLRRNVGH
jgi:hypothetical protein